MPEVCRNIYKRARRARGYTQESAAEQLGISVESLRAYETDQRVPPTEVVELMVICYDAQYLAHQHLRETNAMYGKVVPPVPQVGVLEASARLTNRIYAFAEITKREEKSWKEYYAREARRRWVASPWGLVGTLEGIMQLQECTAGYKIKLMQWAMDAYNEALNETSVNPTDSGRHRTSCPEHTED